MQSSHRRLHLHCISFLCSSICCVTKPSGDLLVQFYQFTIKQNGICLLNCWIYASNNVIGILVYCPTQENETEAVIIAGKLIERALNNKYIFRKEGSSHMVEFKGYWGNTDRQKNTLICKLPALLQGNSQMRHLQSLQCLTIVLMCSSFERLFILPG